jgi:magnesium transporter
MARHRRKPVPRARVAQRGHRTPGAPPGLPEGGVPPTPGQERTSAVPIQVMGFSPTAIVEESLTGTKAIADLRGRSEITWVNLDGTTDVTLIRELGTIFDLHPLALEDVVHTHQRPKVEAYADHLFIVLRMPNPGEGLDFEQMSIFLGKTFVLTIQERPGDCMDSIRQRIRGSVGRIRTSGADYLAYAIIDAILDSFFPLLEAYSDRLDELERRTVAGTAPEIGSEIHAVRHDLQVLRRLLWSTRDLVSALYRNESHLFSDSTLVFLRDGLDHTAQLLDIAEAERELGAGLMDLHISGLTVRGTEIMKVLTLISTIFIPLGFIAGIYGMNFNTERSRLNMPELDWAYGYPFALGIMAITAGLFLWYFRARGWLGQPRQDSRSEDPGSEDPDVTAGKSTRGARP